MFSSDSDVSDEALESPPRNKTSEEKAESNLEMIRYLFSDPLKYKIACFDKEMIDDLLKLIVHMDHRLSTLALEALINISSYEEGAVAIFDSNKKDEWKSLATMWLINRTLEQKYIYAEYTADILNNMTRFEQLAIKVTKLITFGKTPFHCAFQAIYNKKYNRKCKKLSEKMSQLFGNLAQSLDFQKYLLTSQDGQLFSSILPVLNNGESALQKRGIASIIYNCLFNSENHAILLKEPFNILGYLLYPLAGPEEFDEDEVEKMPVDVQYLESDKKREEDPEIRTLLLKSLLMLCDTKNGRTFLRDNQVYPILREYHKWEKDPRIILACENVVDILIRTEEEIGVDNIKGLDVPEDLKEKFDKMDADFINS